MQEESKAASIRKAYMDFDQVSEEEYRTLIRESASQGERDFYYYLYNRMLARKQKKVIDRKSFVV